MKKALFAALCCVLALSACKKIETEVKVTGVSVSPATLSLVEGDSEQLRATVSPSGAANKAVSWTSSATAVATVDNTGKVTAVNAGSATITVKTADGGKTATCAVTVTAKVIPVTGISIDQGATAEVEEGNTITLTATVQPDNATDKTVTWVSAHESIATVVDGVVTGIAPGQAIISAKAGDKTATCTVTVTAVVPAFSAIDLGLSVKWANKNVGAEFPEDPGDYFAWGETEPKQEFSWYNYKWYDGSAITKYNLTDGLSTLLPEDDAANAALGGQWRLPLDEEFKELVTQCTWIQEGDGTVVKGPNGNTIYIPFTGYMDNEVRDANQGFYWTTTLSIEVYYSLYYTGSGYSSYQVGWLSKCFGMAVRPVYGELPHATSVKLNKSQATRYAGGVLQLKANVYPAQATNKDVTWSSSNEGVATVDANGRVTVLAEGEAIITATTMDGGLTAQCKLTVNPIPSGAVFSADAFNSSTDEEPLLILQQDLSNSSVYISKSSGTIDFNGHTVKYLYMQNNDPDKVVGLCNGIISQRLDGDYGWRIKGYHGKVMLEEMEVGEEFYTDGHVYIINSGYYESVDSYRNGSALGDVYIYGGHFKAFNHNPDTRDYQGDIYLFGGKFAMVPSSSYVNPTNPRANNRFIIAEGYSVKENTDEDKEEYPYIVSKD